MDSLGSLEEREAKLIQLIEAIQGVTQSVEWQVLNEELFDGAVESLERRLSAEARKPEIEEAEIYRLQGQLTVAKRYNLTDLLQVFKVELQNIKKRKNENN